MNTISLTELQQAISGNSAAFRCRSTLQPAGGDGDKVFPPTYAGAVYATEERRVKDAPTGEWHTIPCVLLDSVQSQANRLEEALQQAVDDGRLNNLLPVICVDFSGEDLLDDVGSITSLEAPHRVADAILRDSLLDGTPFRKSDLGKTLDQASLKNATPLYNLCPTALVLGIWDSTGPKGGLGAKFQRALVSEIVGINATAGVKTGSRLDPLQIRAAAKVLKSSDGYELAVDPKAKGAVSPSEVNHGNILPDISAGGVTIDSAEQTIVLSLPALRRLRFPVDSEAGRKSSQQIDEAGRVALAALALASVALASDRGFDLRSRCLLWPTEPLAWELLDKPGEEPIRFALDSASAVKLLNEAVGAAEAVGLTWQREVVELTPSPQLVALVRRSQELATTADAGSE